MKAGQKRKKNGGCGGGTDRMPERHAPDGDRSQFAGTWRRPPRIGLPTSAEKSRPRAFTPKTAVASLNLGGFRSTFQKAALEAALPDSLFKKQGWNLHFRSHFSKSSAGSSSSGSTFQKAALEAALLESLFKKQGWKLHFRIHFSKRSAGSCTSGVTFQKECWKLSFRCSFGKRRLSIKHLESKEN